MENKTLQLESVPVRHNTHDPRLVVLDVVLHDGPAGPLGRDCAARARTASLRAGVEGLAQDDAGLGVADGRLQDLVGRFAFSRRRGRVLGDGHVPADDVHGGGHFGDFVGFGEVEPWDGLHEGFQEGHDGDVVAQNAGVGVVVVAGVNVDVSKAVKLAASVLQWRADAGDHVLQGVIFVEAVGGGEELLVADQCAFADLNR